MSVDVTARGLAASAKTTAAAALPKSGGTMTGPITGTSNAVEIANSTTAQSLYVYNTKTDASNYERLLVGWTTNLGVVTAGKAGTGAQRNFVLGGLESGSVGNIPQIKLWTDGTITFSALAAIRWNIDANGHLVAGTDATYDIGAAGATRPRNLYISGYLAAQPPSTQSGTTYTVSTTDYALIFTAGTTCTVTLPAAASFTGRQLRLKGTGGATVVSASSNVVPRAGGAAGTAILALTAGSWAELISDGTNWIIMAGA